MTSRSTVGEAHTPLTRHWTPDDEGKLYGLEELVDMYYQSVGHNCNLLLNANPGPDGLVPEADFQRYVELGTRDPSMLRHAPGLDIGDRLCRAARPSRAFAGRPRQHL